MEHLLRFYLYLTIGYGIRTLPESSLAKDEKVRFAQPYHERNCLKSGRPSASVVLKVLGLYRGLRVINERRDRFKASVAIYLTPCFCAGELWTF